MHRRNRHINASAAGAVTVLDSRYLSGLSNGNGVSTWTNRNTSVGNSPTQATANNQPVYTTNVQGGNPGLLFNNAASSAGRYLTFSTSPISGATAASAIYAFRRTGRDASTPGAILTNFGNEFLEDHEPWGDNNFYTSFASTVRKAFLLTTAVPDNANKIAYLESSTNNWRMFVNSTSLYTTATNTVGIGGSARIGGGGGVRPNGASGGATYFWTGYMYSIMIFKSVLSDALRKRFEISIGYSFKVQTN